MRRPRRSSTLPKLAQTVGSSSHYPAVSDLFRLRPICARFVDNSVVTSLHDWSRLSCCRDWTTATLSSPVFQRQPWHRCSESWTRQRDSFSTWNHVTMQLPSSASCIGYPLHNGSSTSCVYSFIRHSSATHQTTSPTCSQRSPTYQHARRCAPPATATSFFHGRSGDSETVRSLCRSLAAPLCVESVADRTETHEVVDNNIQASSKDISVQLSTLLPLNIEGALQMQLLLLLSAGDVLNCAQFWERMLRPPQPSVDNDDNDDDHELWHWPSNVT